MKKLLVVLGLLAITGCKDEYSEKDLYEAIMERPLEQMVFHTSPGLNAYVYYDKFLDMCWVPSAYNYAIPLHPDICKKLRASWPLIASQEKE